MRTTITLAVMALALAGAPSAAASTVFERDGVLRYEAKAGEVNSVAIRQPQPGEDFWIHELGPFVTTGSGCEQVPPPTSYPDYRQRCTAAGVESVLVQLGDGDDYGSVETELPATISGGHGRDSLRLPLHGTVSGGPGDDFFSPAPAAGDASVDGGAGNDTISFDTGASAPRRVNVALDGPPVPAHTHVLRGVENVLGSADEDVIAGSAAANRLNAQQHRDVVDGAGGNDRIEAIDLYFNSGPHEPPRNYAPATDRVRCGAGHDVLNADIEDVFGDDCERVTVSRVVSVRTPDKPWGREERLRPVVTILRGTPRADRLIGARKVPNRIFGNAGADRIAGGRRADALFGGAGADAISARDGRRDDIRCGTGRDRVEADRRDRVARDCELVQRRR